MANASNYKIGFCNECRRNVHHFRGRKTSRARVMDCVVLFVRNFGPWYCAECEKQSGYLPWFRRSEPTIKRIDNATEPIGNFIRSDGSLILRKKRSSRYSTKFRQGVVMRLANGKTNIAQLTTELNVTEADLMAWVLELIESRDTRIGELTGLLRSYHRAAAKMIGINDYSKQFDADENLIEGEFENRTRNQ